jgi:hypothetical protein
LSPGLNLLLLTIKSEKDASIVWSSESWVRCVFEEAQFCRLANATRERNLSFQNLKISRYVPMDALVSSIFHGSVRVMALRYFLRPAARVRYESWPLSIILPTQGGAVPCTVARSG